MAWWGLAAAANRALTLFELQARLENLLASHPEGLTLKEIRWKLGIPQRDVRYLLGLIGAERRGRKYFLPRRGEIGG